MSEPNPAMSYEDAPDYDVPGILRGRFNALCVQIVEDTVNMLEIYEADTRVDSFGKKIQPCYVLATFDRTDWAERKLEKNLRKFLAHEAQDELVTTPYEPELGPDLLFLDIATLDVPKEDGDGYTVHLFRTTDEFSLDEDTGAIIPDVVSYRLSLAPIKTDQTLTATEAVLV